MERFRVAAALFCVLALTRAAPGQDVHVARTMVCDTQAQAERLAAVTLTKDLPAALDAVNAENRDQAHPGALACALADVMFVEHERVSGVQASVGDVDVMRVTVIAWIDHGRPMVLGGPMVQFALKKVGKGGNDGI